MPDSPLTSQQRETVADRAQGCCEYCFSQARFSPDPFSIERIIPHSRGGSKELGNLALACQGCNSRKYTHIEALDPVTGETAPLFHSRQHRWAEHFTWNEDFSLLLGLTPTGRATIDRLELNRTGVVKLRRVLYRAGEHPPVAGFIE